MFWKNKKVLVTGNTGFKGTWLSIWLLLLGADVIGYSLNIPTNPSLFELCNMHSKIKAIQGDIINFKLISKIINIEKPDIIFHLAAQPLVLESYNNPIMTFKTNTIGTLNLLEAVRLSTYNKKKVIINITTDKVYKNINQLYRHNELDELGGYDIYSASKSCSELLSDSFRDSFFNVNDYNKHYTVLSTARAGNVLGGGDFNNRLVPNIIKAITNNTQLTILSKAIRPWQHVFEALHGYMLLAEKCYTEGIKYSGAWNFGPEECNEKNVGYIVNKLCELWNKNININDVDEHGFHETLYLKLNSDKAIKQLGFKSILGIDDVLSSVVYFTEQYLNNNNMFDVCKEQILEYNSKIIK